MTATRVYDAFGAVVSSTGTWKGPFGYAGGAGYQDDASGLKLLGHRYYDSSTGRFLTRDPAKDGRNWYGYCQNRPSQFSDPTGHWVIIVVGSAVALFLAIKVGEAIGRTVGDHIEAGGGVESGRLVRSRIKDALEQRDFPEPPPGHERDEDWQQRMQEKADRIIKQTALQ